MNPRFYFATCQVGAEKAVKVEVLAECPQLKFAFSRPGFITFKEDSDQKPALILKKAIFTRLWGEVLGQTKDEATLPELLKLIPAKQVIQIFDRDQFVPGDEPESFVQHSHIQGISSEISGFEWNGIPALGAQVYSLIWVDDFHVFLGRHTYSENLSNAPGNIPKIKLSEESPSRAYLKIEEAFYRFKPKIEKGMQVLEIGCSPGGATVSMISRGLMVTGIDPKNMDPKIYKLAGFKHIQKPAKDITATDLSMLMINPEWIVLDMNTAPLETLDELNHVISLLRKNLGKNLKLKQGFLTIKLNDWKFASSIPLYLKRLEEMGFQDLHPIQLATNRQEFFVWSSKFRV